MLVKRKCSGVSPFSSSNTRLSCRHARCTMYRRMLARVSPATHVCTRGNVASLGARKSSRKMLAHFPTSRFRSYSRPVGPWASRTRSFPREKRCFQIDDRGLQTCVYCIVQEKMIRTRNKVNIITMWIALCVSFSQRYRAFLFVFPHRFPFFAVCTGESARFLIGMLLSKSRLRQRDPATRET